MNTNEINPIISVNRCFESLPNNLGEVSTFVDVNRLDNSIIRVAYHYHHTFGCKSSQVLRFTNYQDLLDVIEQIQSYIL